MAQAVEHERVWAVSMMRDEEDIAAEAILQLIYEGVDGIIVADNRSKDKTGEILKALQETQEVPIIIEQDDEVGYYQARKMTRLANIAHSRYGASWIIPFDADEIWYAEGDRVAVELRGVPQWAEAVAVGMYNHWRTALDLDDYSPVRSMVYRATERNPLDKIAFRWRPGVTIHQGNHGLSVNYRVVQPLPSVLRIRHFPYRSAEQMIRKARNGNEAYRATNLPPVLGQHWRQYGELIEREGEEAFTKDVFEKWYYKKSPTDEEMVLDPAPFCRWWVAKSDELEEAVVADGGRFVDGREGCGCES